MPAYSSQQTTYNKKKTKVKINKNVVNKLGSLLSLERSIDSTVT